ncbi:hypothetical protein Misp02_18480 [Microtetraspora sp. NBRC 16547]|nr:hypothetical protein Misp02_18480 [Microtetraspora sp. NBRC 16547]
MLITCHPIGVFLRSPTARSRSLVIPAVSAAPILGRLRRYAYPSGPGNRGEGLGRETEPRKPDKKTAIRPGIRPVRMALVGGRR